MKNEKGISLITLLITVIVIVIISSISIYNGVNTINDTKRKDLEDRLVIIGNAILKDDTFLNFSGDPEIVLEQEEDYINMGLRNYYELGDVLTVRKDEIHSGDNTIIEYTLTLKKDNMEGNYSFNYNLYNEKFNYNVSFDETKGVNRPIIIQGMKALMPDGVTEVSDVFKDDWYSYNKTNTNFAKMLYKDKIYVWIPRFAYDIQNFYEERNAVDVPATAINIIFLRETSSYMVNNEVVQGEYKVHPAFSNGATNYSGIWVEQNVRDTDVLSSAITEIASNNDNIECNMHLMTNIECGAIMYLMHSYENPKDIKLEKDEFIAATADGTISGNGDFVTRYTLDESGDIILNNTFGDAFMETPWNRVISDYPNETNNYVIRRFSSGRYDFTNSDGNDEAYYRSVIVIK